MRLVFNWDDMLGCPEVKDSRALQGSAVGVVHATL